MYVDICFSKKPGDYGDLRNNSKKVILDGVSGNKVEAKVKRKKSTFAKVGMKNKRINVLSVFLGYRIELMHITKVQKL